MNIDLSSIAFEVVSRATTDPELLRDRILEITFLKRAHLEEYEAHTWQESESRSFTSRIASMTSLSEDEEEALVLDIQDTKDDLDHDVVYVLARDIDTYEAIGVGSLSAMTKSSTRGVLSDAYVRPDYRRHGIYSQLIYEREAVARARGFTKLITYPARDGRSRQVLERHGYANKKEGTDDHYMIKNIGESMGEHGFRISGERM